MEGCCVLEGMKLVSRGRERVKELRVHRIVSNQLVLGRKLICSFARHVLLMPRYRLIFTCRRVYEIDCIHTTKLEIISSVKPKLVLLKRAAQISRDVLVAVNRVSCGDTFSS